MQNLEMTNKPVFQFPPARKCMHLCLGYTIYGNAGEGNLEGVEKKIH